MFILSLLFFKCHLLRRRWCLVYAAFTHSSIVCQHDSLKRGYELQKRLHPSIRNNSVNFCRGNSFFRDQVTHSTHVTAIKMLVIAVHCQIWIQCFISQFISVNMYSRRWKLLLLCSSAGFICHELHHFTSSWFTWFWWFQHVNSYVWSYYSVVLSVVSPYVLF